MASVVTDTTTGGVIGQVVQARRTSTGNAAADTILGDEFQNVSSGNGADTVSGGDNSDTIRGGTR